MYVEDAIAKLLRSEPVAGIDFDLNGLHITGAKFDRVAGLIKKGNIKVRIDSDLCSNGRYDVPGDFLVLPTRRISDRNVQMTIVHEATHAVCDLAQAGGYVYVEESAAFLAAAIFARRAGLSLYRPQKVVRNWPESCDDGADGEDEKRRAINAHRRLTGKRLLSRRRSIDADAHQRISRAAQALMTRFHLDQPVPNRRRLAWNEFAALRRAVASSGTYEYNQLPNEPGGPLDSYDNDGIRRGPAVPAHTHIAQ